MSDEEIVVKLSLDDRGYKVAVVSAGSVMKEFKRSLDSTATSIKKVEEHQFSLGRKFRDLVMTMGALRFVAMDINDIFLRLPMAILKTAGELERMQFLMKGLSKELTEAGKAAEGLRDFKFVTDMAKNAPFEIGALSDSFVKLKVAGIDPTNGSMKALVDSVARFGGNGESMKRASIAIQQMAGKGVVSMEELRQQLGEAVPTAMQAMADGMGVSMQELAKIVQTGTLAAGPALRKMLVQMQIDNAGAAAKMMNNWTGMTSQLKTEWDLTAKAIADAGFADESKKAITELIALLQSDEFRRFGVQFGDALGGVVKGLVDVTKFIVEYRDEIELLVKAWLAYKVVTSIIAPISKGVESSFGGAARAVRTEIAAIQESIVQKRNSAAESIAAARAEERAARDRAINVIQAKKLETEEIRVQNQRILNDYNRLNAALAAAEARRRGGVTMPGVPGAESKDSARRRLEDMRMAMAENTRAAAANAQEIRAQQRAIESSSLATAASIANIQGATRAMDLKTVAARAGTLASKGFGAVVGALGGPVGIGITALMLLVDWYNNVANAAEESAARQKRANMGVADSKDKKKLDEDLLQAEAELAGAMARGREKYTFNETAGGAAVGRRLKTLEDAQKDADAIGAASRKVQAARTAAANAAISVMDATIRDEVAVANRAAELQLREIDTNTKAKTAAILKKYQSELSAEKEGSDKAQKVRNKMKAEERAVYLSDLKAKIEVEKRLQQEASSALLGATTSAEKAKYAAILDARTKSRESLEQTLKSSEDAIAESSIYKPKKGDKGSNTASGDGPFTKFIEDLRERRAQLEAELEGFDEVEGKSDKAAGVYDRVIERWKNGDFINKKSGKNIGFMQADSAAREAQEEVLLKQRIKDRQEIAEKARQFADFVKGMEPEYLDAIEVLQDPLGKTKMGRSEKQAFKMLGGMSEEELKAAAQRMGTTVERVKAELINKAQTIDSVSFFQSIEQETKQINDSLVDDSREAAVKRMAADNERHAQEMRNLYEKRQASGQASDEELLQLQRIIEANVEARAAKLANAAKSPLEKLSVEWKNTTRNLEEATTRWAESAADAFVNMATTGKLNFRDMAISILADLAKIQIKAAMSPFLNVAGSFISGLFGGATGGGAGVNYSIAPPSGGGLGLKFADGGIMTEFGSLPLKKYANGGIARSPQLAMFGEGKTPEAYVPLPDGRTIPVTLKGGAQQATAVESNNVQINITVNNDGSSTSDASGGAAELYKRMGERIKSVVREELMNESRPGGVLYR